MINNYTGQCLNKNVGKASKNGSDFSPSFNLQSLSVSPEVSEENWVEPVLPHQRDVQYLPTLTCTVQADT